MKYKLASSDWRRVDLYQVVAFATGFSVSNALMVDFNRNGTRNAPTLQIGDVEATNVSWLAQDAIDPHEAAASLCKVVDDWIVSGSS